MATSPIGVARLTPDEAKKVTHTPVYLPRSEFAKGGAALVDELQALGGGAVGLAGEALGLESVRDWGLDTYRRNMEESTAGWQAPKVAKIEETGLFGGDKSLGDWAAYHGTKGIGTLASLALSGGIGGAIAKAGVRKGVKELAKKEVGKKVLGAPVTAAGKQAAQEHVRKQVVRGATAGGLTGAFGMEGGGAFGQQVSEGVAPEDALLPSFSVGAVNAALEMVAPLKIAKSLGLTKVAKEGVGKAIAKDPELRKQAQGLAARIKKASQSVPGRVAGGAISTGALEGLTESIQELVQLGGMRWAKDEELLQELAPEDRSQLLNAFAAGGLTGAIFGGAAGPFMGKQGEQGPTTEGEGAPPATTTETGWEEPPVGSAGEGSEATGAQATSEAILDPQLSKANHKAKVLDVFHKGTDAEVAQVKREYEARYGEGAVQKDLNIVDLTAIGKVDATRGAPVTSTAPPQEAPVAAPQEPSAVPTEGGEVEYTNPQSGNDVPFLNPDAAQTHLRNTDREETHRVVQTGENAFGIQPIVETPDASTLREDEGGLPQEGQVEEGVYEGGSGDGEQVAPEGGETTGEVSPEEGVAPQEEPVDIIRKKDGTTFASPESATRVMNRMWNTGQLRVGKGKGKGRIAPARVVESPEGGWEIHKLMSHPVEKPTSTVSPEALSAFVANTDPLLGEGNTQRVIDAGVLLVNETSAADAPSGVFDPVSGQITINLDKIPEGETVSGVLLHEGWHGRNVRDSSGQVMQEVLGDALGGFHADLQTLANNGSTTAQQAIENATRSLAQTLGIEHQLAELPAGAKWRAELERVRKEIAKKDPTLLPEEDLAYYIQAAANNPNVVERGYLKRLIEAVREWWRGTDIYKALQQAGVRPELTEQMALEIAKQSLQQTVARTKFVQEHGRAPTSEEALNLATPLYSFAGEKAKFAQKGRLQAAKNQLRAGYDHEEVRQSTNWFQGIDGKWRFEVSDKEAKLRHFEELKEGAVYKLGQILQHPRLFAQYPELQDVYFVKQAAKNDPEQLSQGGFSSKKNAIVVRPYARDPLSTILHEAQHWIQLYEGFAQGGDSKTVFDNMPQEQKLQVAQDIALDARVPDEVATKLYEGDMDVLKEELQKRGGMHELYRRIAGEVEARNVQRRQRLSEADRMLVSPESTETIPRSKQIVLRELPAGARAEVLDSQQSVTPEMNEQELASQLLYSFPPVKDIGKKWYTNPASEVAEDRNQPGYLNKLVTSFVDAFHSVKTWSKEAYRVLDEHRNIMGASHDFVKREYFQPMLKLVRRYKPTAEELAPFKRMELADPAPEELAGHQLAARHVILDGHVEGATNVNEYLALKAAPAALKKLMPTLDKDTQARLQEAIDKAKGDGSLSRRDAQRLFMEYMHENVAWKRWHELDKEIKELVAKPDKTEAEQARLLELAKSADEILKKDAFHVTDGWIKIRRRGSGYSTAQKNSAEAKIDEADGFLNVYEVYREAQKNPYFERLADVSDKLASYQLDTLMGEEGRGILQQHEVDALRKAYPRHVPLRRADFDYDQAIEEALKKPGEGMYHLIDREGSANHAMAANVIQNHLAAGYGAGTAIARNEMFNKLADIIYADKGAWEDKLIIQDKREHKADVAFTREGKTLYLSPKEDNLRAVALMRTLARMDAEQLKGPMRLMRSINNWIRWTAVSANPAFLLANTPREYLTARYNLKASEAADYSKEIGSWKAYKEAFKALRQVVINDDRVKTGKPEDALHDAYIDLVEDYERSGGKTSFVETLRPQDSQSWRSFAQQVRKASGKKRAVVEWGENRLKEIEDLNIVVENIMRLSTYKVMREKFQKQGLSEKQASSRAAELSRNLTTNFTRRGAHVDTINTWWLFYNSTVQGNWQVIQNLLANDNKSGAKRLQKAVGGTILFSFLLDQVGRAMNDDWDEIPEYEKDRNIITPLKVGDDHVTIPGPWVFNIFWRAGSLLSEVTAGVKSPDDAMLDLMGLVVSSMDPVGGGKALVDVGTPLQAVSPSAFDPFAQIAENRDFMGNPLGPEGFLTNNRPDAYVAWDSTPEGFKSAAQFVNRLTGGNVAESGLIDWRPSTYETLYNFVLGGIGRFGVDLAQTAGIGGGKNVFEREGPADLPGVKAFFAGPTDNTAVSLYHDRIAKILSSERLVKELRAGPQRDPMKLAQVRRDRAALLRMGGYARSVEEQTRALRKSVKSAVARGDSRAEERLRERIVQLQRRFNQSYARRVGN